MDLAGTYPGDPSLRIGTLGPTRADARRLSRHPRLGTDGRWQSPVGDPALALGGPEPSRHVRHEAGLRRSSTAGRSSRSRRRSPACRSASCCRAWPAAPTVLPGADHAPRSNDHGIAGTIGLTGSRAGAVGLGDANTQAPSGPAPARSSAGCTGAGPVPAALRILGDPLHQGMKRVVGEGGGIARLGLRPVPPRLRAGRRPEAARGPVARERRSPPARGPLGPAASRSTGRIAPSAAPPRFDRHYDWPTR